MFHQMFHRARIHRVSGYPQSFSPLLSVDNGGSSNSLSEGSSMKTYKKLALAFLLLILIVPPVGADEHLDEWERLYTQATENYQAAKYDLAAKLAKKQLALAEKHLPSHVATSLNNLGALYNEQGLYALAEPLYKRSLAIVEKALGPNHPRVATGLNNLALLYKTQGKFALAEPLYKRALAIHEKALGPDHPQVAIGLSNLADLYRATDREAEAEKLEKRAAAIEAKPR